MSMEHISLVHHRDVPGVADCPEGIIAAATERCEERAVAAIDSYQPSPCVSDIDVAALICSDGKGFSSAHVVDSSDIVEAQTPRGLLTSILCCVLRVIATGGYEYRYQDECA